MPHPTSVLMQVELQFAHSRNQPKRTSYLLQSAMAAHYESATVSTADDRSCYRSVLEAHIARQEGPVTIRLPGNGEG